MSFFLSTYPESYTKIHKQIFENSQWKHIKWFYTENLNKLEFTPIFSHPKVQLFWTNSNNCKNFGMKRVKTETLELQHLHSIRIPLDLKKKKKSHSMHNSPMAFYLMLIRRDIPGKSMSMTLIPQGQAQWLPGLL